MPEGNLSMSAAIANVPVSPAEGEITATRLFDAPREVLFQAFTDPAQLARWWGPKGFTNTFQEFDLRPGGMWRFVMHGPDGANFENESQFLEIVTPERIVLQHLEPVHGFRMTMTYAAEGDKTRLNWQMLFEPEEAARIRQFVEPANEQNFDRLQAHLDELAASG
jgi:uncharacterized protein YndB with AHSA1/START domain